jgi:exonuclease-1
MGIQGLLRWADSVHTDSHISMFKGKKLAVDLLCWIHKAVHGCGISIAIEKNIYPLVSRLWYRIKEIQAFDITLVLVLDGADLPLKTAVDNQRKSRRDKSLNEAIIAFEKGRAIFTRRSSNS